MTENEENFKRVCENIPHVTTPLTAEEKALRLQELFEILEDTKAEGSTNYNIATESVTLDMIFAAQAHGYTFNLKITKTGYWYEITW